MELGKLKSKKILGFTPRTKKILENASNEAKKLNSEFIGTEHILIGILKEGDSVAVRVLINLNVDIKNIYEDILKVITENVSEENRVKSKKESSISNTPTLNQYGIDLTKRAKDRKTRSNNWKKR